MTAPGEIIGLVERFDRNRDAYRSPQYNEMQLRREFLDPFFTAPGWDVDNRAGWPEAYLEQVQIAKGAWLKAARSLRKPIPRPKYRPAIHQVG